MNDERLNAAEMTQGLPLFPLPRYTLFPQTLVPFHVYERRYRAMIGDCLSGSRLLVVASLRPGWELAPAQGPPPVHAVAGLGRVLSDRRYPDGRFDLFVHGLTRVRLTAMVTHEPWTVVDVEPLPDVATAPPEPAYQRLAAVARRLADTLGDDGDPVRELLKHSGDAASLSHRIAALLVDDFAVRQQLFETRCPVARCERLVGWLGDCLVRATWEPSEAALAH